MSSQASSGGHGEKEVRRKIVETGHVDVMISIRPNFFYTRAVPCELWFFDKGKPKEMLNKVLMIDARNIYRKVTRKIFDFSPEQLKNLSAIVWLYRGKTDRYLALVKEYLNGVLTECGLIPEKLEAFDRALDSLKLKIDAFAKIVEGKKELNVEKKKLFAETLKEWKETESLYEKDRDGLIKNLKEFRKKYDDVVPDKNAPQHKARETFDPVAEKIKGLIKQIDLLYKIAARAADIVEKDLNGHEADEWDSREANKQKKELDSLRKDAVEQLKLASYYHRQIHWLQVRFPDAKLTDVEGLVKLVDKKEIAKNDWSLTPGRYVGVAPPEEDEDFDFEEALRDIHVELADLNKEAGQLAKTIQQNFEELGI
jgi:type I restriction enzyme M protein